MPCTWIDLEWEQTSLVDGSFCAAYAYAIMLNMRPYYSINCVKPLLKRMPQIMTANFIFAWWIFIYFNKYQTQSFFRAAQTTTCTQRKICFDRDQIQFHWFDWLCIWSFFLFSLFHVQHSVADNQRVRRRYCAPQIYLFIHICVDLSMDRIPLAKRIDTSFWAQTPLCFIVWPSAFQPLLVTPSIR